MLKTIVLMIVFIHTIRAESYLKQLLQLLQINVSVTYTQWHNVSFSAACQLFLLFSVSLQPFCKYVSGFTPSTHETQQEPHYSICLRK